MRCTTQYISLHTGDTDACSDSLDESQSASTLTCDCMGDLEEFVAELLQKLEKSLAAEYKRFCCTTEESLRHTVQAVGKEVYHLRKRLVSQRKEADDLHNPELTAKGDTQVMTSEADAANVTEISSKGPERSSSRVSSKIAKCKSFQLDAHWCKDADCAQDIDYDDIYRLTASKRYESDLRLLLQSQSRMFPELDPQEDVKSNRGWISGLVAAPSSRSRITWSLIGTLVLCIDALRIPLQVFHPPNAIISNFFEMLSIVYWTLDMVVSSMTGYVDKAGVLVSHPGAVFKHYLQSWFLLDTVTVVADWVGILISEWSSLASVSLARMMRVVRIVRLIRVLRLLRIRKLQNLMALLQEQIDSEGVMIIIRLLRNVAGIIALNHFLACFWYWLGGHDVKGYPSWIQVYKLKSEDWLYNYLTSMHWSLTQFTPASMMVQPQNVLERGFTILLILFAMIIFSSFVSAVTNSTMRLWTLGAGRRDNLLQFRKFLRQNSISPELSFRLNRYLQFVHVAEKHVLHIKHVNLIPSLSVPLQQELKAELLMRYVDGHPLFVEINILNSQLLRKMCSECVNDKFLSRGDVLFSAGQMAQEMCFVIHGVAAYAISGDVTATTEGVYRGNWFCEPTLWTRWMHVGHMQATLECELVGINARSFQNLALSHPISLDMMRTYATIFIKLLNSKGESGELSDLLSDLVTSEEILKTLPRRKELMKSRSRFRVLNSMEF